jgi:hypothetical protein
MRRAQEVHDAMRAARALRRPDGYGAAAWRTDQDVLVALARHVPNVFPPLETVAINAGVPYGTVRDSLDRLAQAGLITRQRRPNKPNLYQLLFLTGVSQQGVSGPLDSSDPGAGIQQSGPLDSSGERPLPSEEGKNLFQNDGGTPPPLRSKTPGKKRTDRKPGRKRNEFPGTCCGCGERVNAEAGFLIGKKPACFWCGLGLEAHESRNQRYYGRYREGGGERKRVIPRSSVGDPPDAAGCEEPVQGPVPQL